MICIGCGSFSYFVSKYAHACSITATSGGILSLLVFLFFSVPFFFLVFLYTYYRASD
ncbi:hypothetical protein BDV41DRAFT_546119 [Aspergillus transmontanensis]|uniref:Uncharacterized protein n=1 Tax=Aspergillus transmontanensis TaxID=1034304 RepID=A0A5N6VPH2_9EURO|nr:hypothetical protein BDV41DRAFT_546119 [Aspergillus transmontanensis]